MEKENKINNSLNNSKKKKNNRKKIIIISIFASVLAAVIIYFGVIFSKTYLFSQNRFYDGSSINGIDVSSLSKEEAANIISSDLNARRNELEITLIDGEKSWKLQGKDFEVNPDILGVVEKRFDEMKEGTVYERLSVIQKMKNDGVDAKISFRFVLAGFEEKINEVCAEIEKEPVEPVVEFFPSKSNKFIVSKEENGVRVDKEKLYQLLNDSFEHSSKISVDIPKIVLEPSYKKSDIENNLQLRSSFQTSYKNSISDRKSNIRLALSKFDGKVVEPGEVVSFNETTGSRTKENGFKKANIIVGGIFVEGTGGGVCQASTTLYNALVKADLEIVEVNKHSLPVSYVPLAFDAMVSEGYSDLKFKNSLQFPIYIHAYGDNENAYVEIYGTPYPPGMTVQRRTNFIRTIPHGGDRIVVDSNGEYSDKVLYKGEYFRIKHPHEGYESEAYLDFFSNGELVETKLLRHETYLPQEGIVVEGANNLGEGMTLPKNEVTLVKPQKDFTSSIETISNKLEKQNPTKYSP